MAKDKPGGVQTRLYNRGANVAFLKSNGCVTQAGRLLDAAGDMCGSLIVLDVAGMAAAEAFVAGDPYGKEGLFESVEPIAWNKVI